MKHIVKNKLLYVVIFLAAACLFLFAGLVFTPTKASAETTNMTSDFAFKHGASARLDTTTDGKSGLRFTATFDETLKQEVENGTITELGMIIVPQGYLTSYENQNGTDYIEFFSTKLEKAQFSVQFTSDRIFTDDDDTSKFSIHGALIGIQNYDRVFRAIAYYQKNNTYYYQLHTDGRSICEVATSAIADEPNLMPEEKYSDEELSTLYDYTMGTIDRVIYDATKAAHIEKFTLDTVTDAQGNAVADHQMNTVTQSTGTEHDQTTPHSHFIFSRGDSTEEPGTPITVSYTLDKSSLTDMTKNKALYSGVSCTVGIIELAVVDGLDNVAVRFFDENDNQLMGGEDVLISDFGNNQTFTLSMDDFLNAVKMEIDGLYLGDSIDFCSFVATKLPEEDEGGNTGGDSGGDTGGDTDGDTGGNTGGDSGDILDKDFSAITDVNELEAKISELLEAVDAAGGVNEQNAPQIVKAYNANQAMATQGKNIDSGVAVDLWLKWFSARSLV